MDVALQIIKDWLVTNALVQPLIAVFVVPLALKNLRMPSIRMPWTRSSEVPVDHPLLDVQEGQVRYLGGTEYRLPRKFAVFHGWFFPLWFMAFSVFRATDHQGLSLQVRFTAMVAVVIVLMIPVLLLFRQLQPRWLKEHLATLPTGAKPPPPQPTK